MTKVTATKASRPFALAQGARKRVEGATVQLPGTGAQGVLVPGGIVVTASHCITSLDLTGGMALGDSCLETIKPRKGASFRLSVWAVEPVADVAALGEPDTQEFSDDCDAFEAWREATEAVPMSTRTLSIGERCRVYILTHLGQWVTAIASRHGGTGPDGRVWITYDSPIVGGTSGGPVVNDDGHLVGVVSLAIGRPMSGGVGVFFPVLRAALPRWAVEHIAKAQKAAMGAGD